MRKLKNGLEQSTEMPINMRKQIMKYCIFCDYCGLNTTELLLKKVLNENVLSIYRQFSTIKNMHTSCHILATLPLFST